jgi:hypothetical protein
MVTASVSTDLVNLRNLDVNSLLRLYDSAKVAQAGAQSKDERDRARRALDRVTRALTRRGVRA